MILPREVPKKPAGRKWDANQQCRRGARRPWNRAERLSRRSHGRRAARPSPRRQEITRAVRPRDPGPGARGASRGRGYGARRWGTAEPTDDSGPRRRQAGVSGGYAEDFCIQWGGALGSSASTGQQPQASSPPLGYRPHFLGVASDPCAPCCCLPIFWRLKIT